MTFARTIILRLALAACFMATVSGASAKPLKAYILVGQSNMQGHAEKWVMPGMAADPATKPLYDKLVDADGKFRVFDDVQVTAISGNMDAPVAKTGPLTLGFGGNLGGQLAAKGKHAMKFGPELSRKIQQITYTEEEQQYLAMNKCNQGYHYFGSAKMLARFGEAFARAMIELQRP